MYDETLFKIFQNFIQKLKHRTDGRSQKLHYTSCDVMLTYAYSTCNKDLKAIFFLPITTSLIITNLNSLYNSQSVRVKRLVIIPLSRSRGASIRRRRPRWKLRTALCYIFPPKYAINIPVTTGSLRSYENLCIFQNSII